MKITVKNKEPEVKQVFIKDVPVGYVFEIYNAWNNTLKALKLCGGKIILLTYSSGDDWFTLGQSCWEKYPVKILGKLSEIIVTEE